MRPLKATKAPVMYGCHFPWPELFLLTDLGIQLGVL